MRHSRNQAGRRRLGRQIRKGYRKWSKAFGRPKRGVKHRRRYA